MALFTQAEREQIEIAVAEVEKSTASELVVAVVSQSDDYALPRSVAAGFWSLAVVLGLHLQFETLPMTWLLVAQIIIAPALWALFGWGPLLRWVVNPSRLTRAVQRRALLMFMEQNIHHTRDQSGLLIMFAEREHQVVILGDRGVHHHIGNTGWNDYIDQMVQGVRRGHAAASLLQVIASLGARLSKHFPPRPDDTNELPNQVVMTAE